MRSKPRWKSIAELLFGVVGLIVGTAMIKSGAEGEVVLYFISGWPAILLGMLVGFAAAARISRAWGEL